MADDLAGSSSESSSEGLLDSASEGISALSSSSSQDSSNSSDQRRRPPHGPHGAIFTDEDLRQIPPR
ncbi:MAG: hypothetical protein JST00_07310 [Deltaproteobacteria bacterium]|nr:hypothetical protein [Deltaproteobacteria bacterium]